MNAIVFKVMLSLKNNNQRDIGMLYMKEQLGVIRGMLWDKMGYKGQDINFKEIKMALFL